MMSGLEIIVATDFREIILLSILMDGELDFNFGVSHGMKWE